MDLNFNVCTIFQLLFTRFLAWMLQIFMYMTTCMTGSYFYLKYVFFIVFHNDKQSTIPFIFLVCTVYLRCQANIWSKFPLLPTPALSKDKNKILRLKYSYSISLHFCFYHLAVNTNPFKDITVIALYIYFLYLISTFHIMIIQLLRVGRKDYIAFLIIYFHVFCFFFYSDQKENIRFCYYI